MLIGEKISCKCGKKVKNVLIRKVEDDFGLHEKVCTLVLEVACHFRIDNNYSR